MILGLLLERLCYVSGVSSRCVLNLPLVTDPLWWREPLFHTTLKLRMHLLFAGTMISALVSLLWIFQLFYNLVCVKIHRIMDSVRKLEFAVVESVESDLKGTVSSSNNCCCFSPLLLLQSIMSEPLVTLMTWQKWPMNLWIYNWRGEHLLEM